MQDHLLVVAHGTASADGAATTRELVETISAARPDTTVQLCFLDIASPRLVDALDERPTVVVPLLLSTGYHVQSDIPAAVAGYPGTRVARHLGPHPLLVDALVDRLPSLDEAASIVLVGAGSTRLEAAAELGQTGELLAARLDRPVTTTVVDRELRDRLRALDPPIQLATYLLAEGQFLTSVHAAADGLGSVAGPIGVHPALASLVWLRYDEIGGTR